MCLFKDIQGQEGAVSFLRGAIESGRIANAYLFHGPPGVGKKMAAISFAKALNCLSRLGAAPNRPADAPVDGCGSCPSCRKIDSTNHPDVRLVTSAGDGSSVTIGDVRAVIEDIGLKPYEAEKKVYIIDGADNLTEEAANALLKTLEEPSADSLIILISRNPARLPPTIRSRCQSVGFFRMSPDIVKAILCGKHAIGRDTAHILAGVSCGSPGAALKLNEDDFFSGRESVIKAISSGTLSELDFDKTPRSEIRSALNIMLMWYRDVLVTKAGGDNIMNIDMAGPVSAAAKKADFGMLYDALTRIIFTQACLEQNANPRLAMAALGSSI